MLYLYGLLVFIGFVFIIYGFKFIWSVGFAKTAYQFFLFVFGIIITIFSAISIYLNLSSQNIDLNDVSVQYKKESYIKNNITNDFLNKSSINQIFNNYTNHGRSIINALYSDNSTSKNYGLKLIGKNVDGFDLKDKDNNTITLKSNNNVIVFLTNADKSKTFLKNMNGLNYKDNVNYIAIFPVNTTDEVNDFLKDNNLNSKWKVVSKDQNTNLLNESKDAFNLIGVPSYLILDKDNYISLAGTGTINETSFKNFVNQGLNNSKIYK